MNIGTIGKDEQIEALAQLLKPLGFKKLRGTWHRATADTIQVINVQGSQWGPEYYLNVGTYLRALGAEVAPPEFRCHVRSRIHPSERPAAILVKECQEWFEQFGTVASLLTHSKSGSLPPTTTGAAREWLSAA
jgi:Domain of unknown function (DUF4304)